MPLGLQLSDPSHLLKGTNTMTTTYTVQLRYVPSQFLGNKITSGTKTSLVFDELQNLITVAHFDSEDEAMFAACNDSDFDGDAIPSYFIVIPNSVL